MINRIISLTNPKIKELKKLSDSSAARAKEGKFVLEGLRLCLDCVQNSTIEAEAVFFTESLFSSNEELLSSAFEEIAAFEITDAIAGKISTTESPQGIFLLCKIPEKEALIKNDGRYLALENIQNPSNFGAICRCVEAMGLSGIIVSGGVDVYNPKCLRSAMGSSLRLSIIRVSSLSETLTGFRRGGGEVFAAVPDRSAKSISEASLSDGTIVVVGNEANGVTEETKKLCVPLTIPMKGKAESLNAAAAAAIISWELSK